MTKRKRYSEEQKRRALLEVQKVGAKSASKSLGIPASVLYGWKAAAPPAATLRSSAASSPAALSAPRARKSRKAPAPAVKTQASERLSELRVFCDLLIRGIEGDPSFATSVAKPASEAIRRMLEDIGHR
jgi:transposase-like protein